MSCKQPSISMIKLLIATRSNGAMKVERTASNTLRADWVASLSMRPSRSQHWRVRGPPASSSSSVSAAFARLSAWRSNNGKNCSSFGNNRAAQLTLASLKTNSSAPRTAARSVFCEACVTADGVSNGRCRRPPDRWLTHRPAARSETAHLRATLRAFGAWHRAEVGLWEFGWEQVSVSTASTLRSWMVADSELATHARTMMMRA